MSSPKHRLVLSPKAEQDIENILRYTGETWGEKQIAVYRDKIADALLEELLGERAEYNGFGALDLRQFERCLAHLITLEHTAPSIAGSMLLNQPVEILAWRIGRRSIPTLSRLSMGYGHTRCLSTYLQFETVEDFHSIAAAFAECGMCKLNEKHLKKDRSRQA